MFNLLFKSWWLIWMVRTFLFVMLQSMKTGTMFVRRKFVVLLLVSSILLFVTFYKMSNDVSSHTSSHCDESKSSQEVTNKCKCDEKSTKTQKVKTWKSNVTVYNSLAEIFLITVEVQIFDLLVVFHYYFVMSDVKWRAQIMSLLIVFMIMLANKDPNEMC